MPTDVDVEPENVELFTSSSSKEVVEDEKL